MTTAYEPSQVSFDRLDENSCFVDECDRIYAPQQFDWDCGVACLNMAFRFCNVSNNWDFAASSYSLNKTPLWTIDIFILLHENGLEDAVMYTTYVGVNPTHFHNSWYTDYLARDTERVDIGFQKAYQSGWSIQERNFTTDELILHFVGGGTAAILLVNGQTLGNHHR